MQARWSLMWAALVAACGGDPNSGAPETSGADTGTPTSTSVADTGTSAMPTTESTAAPETTATPTTADASTSSSSDDGGFLFDLGGTPDMPPGIEEGCTKIDFLFVIDNSGSMAAQQAQLLNSFNGFIEAIQTSLDQVDSIHLGVITSDNYAGNQPGCTTIGSLVTQTQGMNSSNMVCTPFVEGERFLTQEDDVEVEFPCIAQVGTSGSPIEQPVTGLIEALNPAMAANGACNDNFIRNEAILVVVIVTDDPPYDFDMDDAHPLTDTSSWHDAVLDAKNGNEDALVVIGFIPWMNVACNGGLESPNLIGFVDSFGDQGIKASVCEADYAPLFADTILTIEGTCAGFTP